MMDAITAAHHGDMDGARLSLRKSPHH